MLRRALFSQSRRMGIGGNLDPLAYAHLPAGAFPAVAAQLWMQRRDIHFGTLAQVRRFRIAKNLLPTTELDFALYRLVTGYTGQITPSTRLNIWEKRWTEERKNCFLILWDHPEGRDLIMKSLAENKTPSGALDSDVANKFRPGGRHENLMVSATEHLLGVGISPTEIQAFTSLTDKTYFQKWNKTTGDWEGDYLDDDYKHADGTSGTDRRVSKAAHNELAGVIYSAKSRNDVLIFVMSWCRGEMTINGQHQSYRLHPNTLRQTIEHAKAELGTAYPPEWNF